MRCDGEGRFPRTRESENVTFRLGLPRLRGRWPAGPERARNEKNDGNEIAPKQAFRSHRSLL